MTANTRRKNIKLAMVIQSPFNFRFTREAKSRQHRLPYRRSMARQWFKALAPSDMHMPGQNYTKPGARSLYMRGNAFHYATLAEHLPRQNKWLRGRIAALLGTRPPAYLFDMSRSLRSGRLPLHPARSLLRRFPHALDRWFCRPGSSMPSSLSRVSQALPRSASGT